MIPAAIYPTSAPAPIGGPISSAGVFNSSGALVRTLWAASANDPRVVNPGAFWDGTDDLKNALPAGIYTVKLLQHNMQYTWDGAIGNTSPYTAAARQGKMTYHNEGLPPCYITIPTGGKMFYTTNYNERWPTATRTTLADPNTINYPFSVGFRTSYVAFGALCTDNTNIYWNYAPSGGGTNYVVGTAVADDSFVVFSAGTPANPTGSAIMTADNTTVGGCSGLTCSPVGTFLFGTYNSTGTIIVANKTTGATLQTYANSSLLNQVFGCVANPTNNTEVWISYSVGHQVIDSIVKCSVNTSTGAITPTATVITGLAQVLSMTISPDGTTLLVMDTKSSLSYNSQQLKAFNTSDGSVKTAFATNGVFGQLGGYQFSPAVSPDRFGFEGDKWTFGGTSGAVCYAPDGSFWVSDTDCSRCQHFSAGNTPTFIEVFSYLGAFYSCRTSVNENPPTVFANCLEFEIDYSKPLLPNNGSWRLINNWGYGIPASAPFTSNLFMMMRGAGTYSNGRRYCSAQPVHDFTTHVYEMTPTGLRFAGTNFFSFGFPRLDMQGSIIYFTGSFPNFSVKLDLVEVSFDSNNNPVWGTEYIAMTSAQTFNLANDFPVPNQDGAIDQPSDPLANGAIPMFQTYGGNGVNIYPRVGALHYPDGALVFTCHPVTPQTAGLPPSNLTMLFPDKPYFSTTGGVGNAGGMIVYRPGDTCFFTSYRGENWGNNQTNMVHHWHQTGLLIERFGEAAPYFAAPSLMAPEGQFNLEPSTPPYGTESLIGIPCAFYSFKGMRGLTGNSAYGGVAKVNGVYYVFQNDEWYQGGITRWSATGYNTVKLTVTNTINFNGTPTTPNDPTDLLQGLPYASVDLPNNTAGWTRNPTVNDPTLLNWAVQTNNLVSDPHLSPDLMATAVLPGGTTRTVSRSITRSGSGDWSLTSQMLSYPGIKNFPPADNINYETIIEILDNSAKVIFKFEPYAGTFIGGATHGILINDVLLTPPATAPFTDATDFSTFMGAMRLLSVAMSAATSKMAVTFDVYSTTGVSPYDGTANPLAPTTFLVTFTSGIAAAGGDLLFDFRTLNFIG